VVTSKNKAVSYQLTDVESISVINNRHQMTLVLATYFENINWSNRCDSFGMSLSFSLIAASCSCMMMYCGSHNWLTVLLKVLVAAVPLPRRVL